MIDWNATKDQFNIGVNALIPRPGSPASVYRPKVVCICDNCRINKVITIRNKSKIDSDGQMSWLCPKCVSNKPENRKKLSDIGKALRQPNKSSAYHRWWQRHKGKILAEKRRIRESHLHECQGCKKPLSKSDFYYNGTYIHPYCKECEIDEKHHRYMARRMYYQLRRKTVIPSKSYHATTLAVCERNNYNNIYSKNLARCKSLGIKSEVSRTQYRQIINKWLARNDDRFICYYCHQEIIAFCFDHYMPLAHNGAHRPSNLRISCPRCNLLKHDLLPDQFSQLCKSGKIDLRQVRIDPDIIYAYSSHVPTEWKFPYWSDKELQADFNRFMNAKLQNKFIQTISAPYCYIITKHFHRAFWQSTKTNCLPVTHVFDDRQIIDNAIKEISTNGRVSYIRLLRQISYFTDYKYPSIFSPLLAAEVLTKFSASDDIIYDPCAGWGARWLAAVKLNRQYICSDPNAFIRAGLYKISNFFGINIELHDYGIPDMPELRPNVIFTSPPWGNNELYAGADKTPDNILTRLCAQAKKVLKPGGRLILHLPDANGLPTPDERLEVQSRGTYHSTARQSIFIWKRSSL